MATNTQNEPDAQNVDDGIPVNKAALGEVYEASSREFDAREDLHAHPEGEKETLKDALDAVAFAIDEGIVKTDVCVVEEHLSVVLEAAKIELDSMSKSGLADETGEINPLREAINTVERSLHDSDEEGR